MKSKKIIALAKGVWAFCSYLFWPQRRAKENAGGDMKKDDRVLLLRDFLETNDYEGCKFQEFDMALENVEDEDPDGFALYHLDNLFYDIFQKIPAVNEERTLFRFARLSAEGEDKGAKWEGSKCYVLNDIKDGKLTFTAPKLFNDPMDPLIKEWAKRRKKQYKDEAELRMYQLINATLDKIRISCFCDPLHGSYKRKQGKATILDCNPLMWAHYADSHKGIGIQYRIKPSNLKDEKNMVVRLLDVNYDKPFPIDGNIPFIDSLCVKGDFWRYEKETRLILYSREDIGDYYSVDGYEIEAVYMGCRMEKEKREYLKNMIKGTGIYLYQMVSSDEDMTKLEMHQVR